ncbi:MULTISPECIES: thioesterase II family protein [unclassified Streptomyces]|uniref:thioesterase II family protein n=1 Tax=unclassified Streptomyces TaxID=2593676 RepID=UPI0004C0AEB9|nr:MULTISPECIES: alpha/beta fold hydrolase [unclassified Streptomyces]KOX09745.1 oleoyl-ACP hydrolase [Streptomyces sp. NRRL B-3648]
MSAVESRWLRRFAKSEDSELQLVCFPHAGGAASAYLGLTRALAPDIDVVAVQYPGRQDRRLEPVPSLVHLARAVAEELARAPRRPYAFFGHSMGAVVAYETARVLTEFGLATPLRLILSGRGAPGPEPRAGDRLEGDAALIAEIRRLGGTGSRVLDDPELLEMVLPTLRADYGALGRYRWLPGPPLDIPLTVMVGTADPVVPVEDARGWLAHSTRPGDLLTFDGGHFYLDTQLPSVARAVRTLLAHPTPV